MPIHLISRMMGRLLMSVPEIKLVHQVFPQFDKMWGKTWWSCRTQMEPYKLHFRDKIVVLLLAPKGEASAVGFQFLWRRLHSPSPAAATTKKRRGELSALLNSHERCTSCKGVLLQCIINALANHFSITYLLWQDFKWAHRVAAVNLLRCARATWFSL